MCLILAGFVYLRLRHFHPLHPISLNEANESRLRIFDPLQHIGRTFLPTLSKNFIGLQVGTAPQILLVPAVRKMRETRLYRYVVAGANSHSNASEVAFPPPSRSLSPIAGTWAGLANLSISWRVEGNGRIIIFEDLHNSRFLRVTLSGPLSCRPLLRFVKTETSSCIDAIFACYSQASILLHVRINTSGSRSFSCTEISRSMIHRSFVTCMQDVNNEVVIGLNDGSCMHVKFGGGLGGGMKLDRFVPPPLNNAERRRNTENMSVMSGVSEESVSNRSVASTMSFGFMNRLFGGTPRAGATSNGTGIMEATSQTLTQSPRFLGRGREDRSSVRHLNDQVRGIASVHLDAQAVAALYQSGRICLFKWADGEFRYVNDLVLPVRLSTGLVNHFLLAGLSGSIIAVVMADEDPNADSLRVFKISATVRDGGAITMAHAQIAQRHGPIDRIVAAVHADGDVIVASETGYVSGVVNVSADGNTTTGIPYGTLWTTLDDMNQPYGLESVLDGLGTKPQDLLLQAHRFSSKSLAKSLRMENAALQKREDIEENINATYIQDDASNTWLRIKARAQHISQTEDLPVRDIFLTPGAGIVIARNAYLSILRQLSNDEKQAHGKSEHLIPCKSPISDLDTAVLLSSHALSQLIASKLFNTENEDREKAKLTFMLGLSSSFSKVSKQTPLTDRLALHTRNMVENSTADSVFNDIITRMIEILQPGAALLSFLNKFAETEYMSPAADQVIDTLPVSAMVASGLSWLGSHNKSDEQDLVLKQEPKEELELIGEEKPNDTPPVIQKAFACFFMASTWGERGVELLNEDMQCVLDLVGLSREDVLNQSVKCPDEDIEMTAEKEGLSEDLENARIRTRLSFWMLERVARLFDLNGAPESAAAIALQAMSRAPDRERYEMMRATAFGAFMSAKDLDHALAAILEEPFPSSVSHEIIQQESKAVRDSIGLLTEAAADQGRIRWLASRDLPEPLPTMCGIALEKRARAAEVISLEKPKSILTNINAFGPHANTSETKKKAVSPYEELFSWYIIRRDESSAASIALEWAERLSDEGLSSIREFVKISMSIGEMTTAKKIELLLSWSQAKSQAYSYASSAGELEMGEKKYVARTRFAIVSKGDHKKVSGLMSMSWISRRHLLAHAQSRVLAELLSSVDLERDIEQTIDYLLSSSSNNLGEVQEGVLWVAEILTRKPSFENLLLSAELGRAWREEAGDGVLIQAVQRAAQFASRKLISGFGYNELNELIKAVKSSEGKTGRRSNWNLLALESVLAASAGAAGIPEWLIDSAAWGKHPIDEGDVEATRFSGCPGGDAGGTVRVLLCHHRPYDAVRVALTGLEGVGKEVDSKGGQGRFYVPYTAIEALMERLEDVSETNDEAVEYLESLKAGVKAHFSAMEELIKTGRRNGGEIMAM